MSGKRYSNRTPLEETIICSITVLDIEKGKMLRLNGKVVDISDKGMRIETGHPLEPESVIKIGDGKKDRIGIVRWCRKNGNSYSIGIRFE